MVWACAAKRRQWLGEEIYGVWSGGVRPTGRQKKTWTEIVPKDCQALKFPQFFVSVHIVDSLIFQVTSRSVQVWESYNRKTPPRPPKWLQYRLLKPIIKCNIKLKGLHYIRLWKMTCYYTYICVLMSVILAFGAIVAFLWFKPWYKC